MSRPPAIALPLLLVGWLLLVPLAWLLGLLVLAGDLLASPLVWLSRRRLAVAPARVPRRDVSVVVVSWNGRDHLERMLPSLEAALAAHGGDHEVVLVDNGSTDGTSEWVHANFPRVRVVALPENRFFVRGMEAGIAAATRDTLVLLNNDMVVDRGFLGPLLDGFTADDVFAVTADVVMQDPAARRVETGFTAAWFSLGHVKLQHRLPGAADGAYPVVAWAGGGSTAYDRAKFLALGGFDRTFDPFYLEDAGISYQAWRHGYRVLFCPASRVVHAHRGTSRRLFGDDFVDNTIRRNQHLFVWRNVTSPLLTALHFATLPLVVLHRGFTSTGRTAAAGLLFELRAVARALPRLPMALCRRTVSRRTQCVADAEVVRRAGARALQAPLAGA
ncbi:MAG: hypothetical protein RL148_1447 [Planctomycetota bacterium]